jgi:hypothetical protein
VNPVFDLFLDHFLDSASRLWITAKGLSEFVVPLRLCFAASARLGEHFLGREGKRIQTIDLCCTRTALGVLIAATFTAS